MPAPGELATAPYYVSVQNTTSSSGITTVETAVDTVTSYLTAGKTYIVLWTGNVYSNNTDSTATVKLREDTVSGNLLDSDDIPLAVANKSQKGLLRCEYVAAATGTKAFVVTLVRNAGTGTLVRQAAATIPKALLTVERKL